MLTNLNSMSKEEIREALFNAGYTTEADPKSVQFSGASVDKITYVYNVTFSNRDDGSAGNVYVSVKAGVIVAEF